MTKTSAKAMITIKQSFTTVLKIIIALSLIGVVSLPILNSGYFNDDTLNSLLPGIIKLTHNSFWFYILSDMDQWMRWGRLFPLSIISSVSAFYFFQDAYSYQLLRVIFIWLSYLSFMYVVKLYAKNNYASLFFLLLLPLTWSIKNYANPLTSFAIFLPLLMLFVSGCLIGLKRYIEQKNNYWLAFSILLFLLSLLTYELGTITFLLVIILVQNEKISFSEKITLLKPYLIIFLFFLGSYYALQYSSHSVYDGIKVKLNWNTIHGFIAQLISIISFEHLYSHFSSAIFLNHKFLLLACYLFVSIFFISNFLIPKLSIEKNALPPLLYFGMTLLFYPAFLIGLSEKYQVQVQTNQSYIPIYVQYFAVALLLLIFISRCYEKLRSYTTRRLFSFLVSLIISTVITLTLLVNLHTVEAFNDKFYNQRALLEKALSRHLLSFIPANAYLVEHLYLWNDPSFFELNSQEKIAGIIDIYDVTRLKKYNNKFYMEVFKLKNSKMGFVLLGQIAGFSIRNINNALNVPNTLDVKNPIIYVQYDNQEQYKKILNQLEIRLGNIDNINFTSPDRAWFIKNLNGNYKMNVI